MSSDEGMTNPFDLTADPERHAIWSRLIAADCDAFAAGDWSLVEADFDAERFEGIRCFDSCNPDDWHIVFPTLESYRDSWLAHSEKFRARRYAGRTAREAVYFRTMLNKIQLAGERAMCLKKFAGDLQLEDGTRISGRSQSLFRLHKRSGRWLVVGFLGMLPYEAEGAR